MQRVLQGPVDMADKQGRAGMWKKTYAHCVLLSDQIENIVTVMKEVRLIGCTRLLRLARYPCYSLVEHLRLSSNSPQY